MESKIEQETHRLVETFARTKGQPIDPLPFVTSSVCNVVCLVTLGYCFSPEDTKFQMILEDISNYRKFGGFAFLLLIDLFPWLMKHLPGPHQKIQESIEKDLLIIKEEAEKHSQDLAQHQPKDFIDLYLLEIEKKHSEPNSTFDNGNMTHIILELFFTGIQTTASFLQWALFLMVAYPDIQVTSHEPLNRDIWKRYQVNISGSWQVHMGKSAERSYLLRLITARCFKYKWSSTYDHH